MVMNQNFVLAMKGLRYSRSSRFFADFWKKVALCCKSSGRPISRLRVSNRN